MFSFIPPLNLSGKKGFGQDRGKTTTGGGGGEPTHTLKTGKSSAKEEERRKEEGEVSSCDLSSVTAWGPPPRRLLLLPDGLHTQPRPIFFRGEEGSEPPSTGKKIPASAKQLRDIDVVARRRDREWDSFSSLLEFGEKKNLAHKKML